MHLVRETYIRVLALAISFRILSMFGPLLISDSVDIIAKIIKRSCWIDDLISNRF